MLHLLSMEMRHGQSFQEPWVVAKIQEQIVIAGEIMGDTRVRVSYVFYSAPLQLSEMSKT